MLVVTGILGGESYDAALLPGPAREHRTRRLPGLVGVLRFGERP